MSATYQAIQASATAKLAAANLSVGEALRRVVGLPTLALILAMPTARADNRAQSEAPRLGEHPAVIVARRGMQVDPTSKFYLHPARLSWSLQRPLTEGEHPAVIVARRGVEVDPTLLAPGPAVLEPATTDARGHAAACSRSEHRAEFDDRSAMKSAYIGRSSSSPVSPSGPGSATCH